MDVTDPPSALWKFRPGGYLAVILEGSEGARRVESALVEAGFPPRWCSWRHDSEVRPVESIQLAELRRPLPVSSFAWRFADARIETPLDS